MTYKVAAYLRLSKEEYSNEKESNSITNQKLIIDNYLKEHRKYKLVDYYIDDGYSGTNFDRPEFQRMLEDIKNKKIDVILIKDPKDKHKFLIDKNVSHIIRKIFDMILDGKSRRQVTDFLNDNDILTPSEYLNLNKNEDVSIMKKWNPEMVNTILKNENYTGTLLQGKRRKLNYRVNKQIQLEKENWIITPNHHEAIISKEKFDKVQDILNRQAKVNKDGSIGVLSNITRLELENKVKCIYIDKNKNVKMDIK